MPSRSSESATIMTLAHLGPTVFAAFFASLVEFVEALTIILAVGSVRGWRSALGGTAAALALLLAIVALLGPLLTHIPLDTIQLVVGALLVLFGMRWLRKAILRAAGVIPLHDETRAFNDEIKHMRGLPRRSGNWDGIAFGTTFQITMLEGIEVVFIVIAIGAGGVGLLLPASLGALAALLLVTIVGIFVHRPLAKVPENLLKFVVGVLLSGFGTFWVGEGVGLSWLGGDWSILGLVAGFLILALVLVALCRRPAARQTQEVST
jgi:uncharacterized membrane protein